MSASTERAWVLRREGRGDFVAHGFNMISHDVKHARIYADIHDAYHAAQHHAASASPIVTPPPRYRAVPVEREAGRKVELEHGECVKYGLLRAGKWWAIVEGGEVGSIRDAELFNAVGLFTARGIDDDWTPVPVRVTEQPGEWRVVEESEGE